MGYASEGTDSAAQASGPPEGMGVQLTSRSGRSSCVQTRVITGENRDGRGYLLDAFIDAGINDDSALNASGTRGDGGTTNKSIWALLACPDPRHYWRE